MRGPSDQLIDAEETAGKPAPGVEPAPSPRGVPGGKALLRLLTLLDSAGLTQLGDQIVESAVQGTTVPDVTNKIIQLTTGLPPGASGLREGGTAAPGYAGGATGVGTAFLDAVSSWGRRLAWDHSGSHSARGQCQMDRRTGRAGSTCRDVSQASPSTRPMVRMSLLVPLMGVSGRAGTGAAAGLRGVTTPALQRLAQSRSIGAPPLPSIAARARATGGPG